MASEIAKLFVSLGINATEFTKGLEKSQEQMKKAGIGMMAAGTVITGALVKCTKAANDEQIGINRLSQQLANVGVAYDEVKDSLEGVISATQYKTGVADDQQRAALGDLIIATGDYQRALDLLPLALDLAAAKQMDVGAAAELVGKVAAGNLGTLSRYGIVLQEGATASEALAVLQDKVAGSAEATVNPMDRLKNSMSDLQEAVGKALLPDLEKFVGWAVDGIDKVTKWADANPQLVSTLKMVGITLIGAGGVIFAISQLSKAIVAVNAALAIMQGLSGPKGWATLAAGAAIAAGTIYGMSKLMESATPEIPGYASGGIVPGAIGQPQLAMVHGGETVIPAGGYGSGTLNIKLYLDGEQLGNSVEKHLYDRLRYQEIEAYL